MITLGIDLGTSAVKAVLLDDDRIVAVAEAPLSLDRPHPGWSEQDPQAWWQATCDCLDRLQAAQRAAFTDVVAVGLSGQMHGATLLDRHGDVLRPCILWNDSRSAPQCAELETRAPRLRAIAGNAAMPGFTAPKLLWVREHEPAVFDRIDRVLLPKAWLRWKLCGEFVDEMSDASGTLWLDVARRDWSDELLAACGLSRSQMPRLVEGNEAAGQLRPEWVRRWGFARAPLLAGGAGDNAAGAVGIGAVQPGDAFVSLGTSGVLWSTTAGFAPRPDRGVHAFCHALPNTWHQMGVLLSAAASLSFWARVAGQGEAALLAPLGEQPERPAACWFAPYLAGERTPHNDPAVRGGFLALDSATSAPAMTQAVLEGVAYAFRDARDALASAGTRIEQADLIGGGSRSAYWADVLANVLDLPLHQVEDSDVGCALGAARLACMAAEGGAVHAAKARRVRSFEPRPALAAQYAESYRRWQALYGLLRQVPQVPSPATHNEPAELSATGAMA